MTYTIEKYLTETNKGEKGDNTPEWIIVHFVGAKGQAMENARFFKTLYRGSSAHYFADPKTIVQVVEDDTPAWHIGDGSRTGEGNFNGYIHPGGATNTNTIGIELCQDTSTGQDVWHWQFHPDTIRRAEWLIRQKQVEHKIDDAHVIRHYDASGKLCPGNWQYNDWEKWWDLKDRLEKDIIQPAPSATPKPEGKIPHLEEIMHLVEAGDTLYAIAKEHNVTVQDLIKWNELSTPDLILPETKLFVKDPKVAVPKPVMPKPFVPTVVAKTIDQLADEVLKGKHGSGRERMISLGVNYAKVQTEVNRRLRK